MTKCYLCGQLFDGHKVQKHDEHIIQQAIGGNLIAKEILCSSCGVCLGEEIDAPFNKIFESISARLNIKTDRKGGAKKISCKMDGLVDLNVVWSALKVTPKYPFHLYSLDKREVVIYAAKVHAKAYIKKVEQELKDNFKCDEKPEISICDDLIGMVKFPFSLDNQKFKRGLAKIAVGFATKHGIDRANLPLVLEIDSDTKQGKISEKVSLLPFYPLGIIDKLFEYQKSNLLNFPLHNIILCTLTSGQESVSNAKLLVCYIELFSTFQYYVLLNREYYGNPIHEVHAQHIMKKDNYKIVLGRRYHKERSIWLDSLGITAEYIEKKYVEPKNSDNIRLVVEEKIINEKTIKQKYRFDFEVYLDSVISGMENQYILYQSYKSGQKQFPNSQAMNFMNNQRLKREFASLDEIAGLMDFHGNLALFYSLPKKPSSETAAREIGDDDTEAFSISSFRKFFYQQGKIKFYFFELAEHYCTLLNNKIFRDYGHYKMFMLEEYINMQIISRKLKQEQ